MKTSTQQKRLLKTVILSLVFSALTTVLFAQQAQVKNLEKYDKAWLHFGFLLGTNKTDFKVVRSDNFYKSDSAVNAQRM